MEVGSVYTARLDGIAQVWEVWAGIGDRLGDAGWRTPTRCPGWDVAAVFAHVSMFPVALAGMPLEPPQHPSGDASAGPSGMLTAVDIVRGFNAPGGAAHAMADTVADTAARDAAAHSSTDLTARFAVAGPSAVDRLRSHDPATTVPWPGSGGMTTLVEGLRIVVMESVVHLLDVQHALRLPRDLPDAAADDTVRFLAKIAPSVEFIEAATGRTDHTPLPILR